MDQMNQFFKELFEYSNHYNQQLAEVMVRNPDRISEKALKLMSHLLNAHHIWNNRIDPQQPSFGVWEIHPVAELQAIGRSNYLQTIRILETADLTKVINYTNSKGQVFANTVRDILFHVVNHSTYHRAQIATEFKNQQLDPLVTDYIFYKR